MSPSTLSPSTLSPSTAVLTVRFDGAILRVANPSGQHPAKLLDTAGVRVLAPGTYGLLEIGSLAVEAGYTVTAATMGGPADREAADMALAVRQGLTAGAERDTVLAELERGWRDQRSVTHLSVTRDGCTTRLSSLGEVSASGSVPAADASFDALLQRWRTWKLSGYRPRD